MGFDIDEFRGAISTGIARPNRYEILVPDIFTGGGITRTFKALIDEAEIPGKGFATTERQTHGPIRKMPYQTIYNDFTISIICTKYMEQRRFFDLWQAKIVSPGSNYMSYYNNYVGPLAILTFAEDGGFSYGMLLLEAYPISIAPQPLNYSDNDSLLKLNITFAYHKWFNIDQFSQFGSDSGVADRTNDRFGPIFDGAPPPVGDPSSQPISIANDSPSTISERMDNSVPGRNSGGGGQSSGGGGTVLS